jgi:anti-sigma-K factor RskA
MSDGRHVLDLLADYALGSLEQREARHVTEHLAACQSCRAELAELEHLTGLLAMGAAGAQPSASVRQRLLERAPRQKRPRRLAGADTPRPWWTQRPLWAAASLFIIAALVISNLFLWQRLISLDRGPGPQDMRAIALHNTGVAPEASGYVLFGADGRNGTLVVDKLTPLGDDQAYQLWLMRAGQSTSGALFTVDESGYRGARILAPDSLLTYSSVQITIEPAAGSPAPTGKPVLDAVLDGR